MSIIPDPASADRNLLFGILAVQLDFISRDDLLSGMSIWVQHKEQSLGAILLAQGKLTADQLAALETLIVHHMQAHGNEAARSLRALAGAATVASAVTPIDDPDLQASLSCLGGPPTEDYRPLVAESRHLPAAADGARYRKLRFHREGGQGVVYLAKDTELNRQVALKEIKPQFASDVQTQKRFVLEAEITGNLEHPGVVPVYGLNDHGNGQPYYAMRFISEERLSDAIAAFHVPARPGRSASEQTLMFRQLLRRFVDVCNAIAYAHSRNVIHRDLKPGNIMLGKFGETLVIDWGMAKAGAAGQLPAESISSEAHLQVSPDADLDRTTMGTIKGTYHYMSPEQAEGRIDLVDRATDIYSLGATLFELLTGQRPFANEQKENVLAAVKKGRYRPALEVKPGTPPALDAICRKAMVLEPRDRYPSASALAADVEHWLADEPVSAYAEPWTTRMGRWGRRHQKTVVGAIVASVVAAAALAVSTAVVSAEQRETAKQKDLAVQHFLLARDLSINSIDLFESAELELASKPAMYAKRKEILLTAARSYQVMLAEEPDDIQLRGHAAKVFRYNANLHRQENETEAAVALYRQSIELQEMVIAEQPKDMDSRLQLANTLRDQANQQAKLGKLEEANKNLGKSIEIAEEIFKADKENATARRAMAASQLDLSAIAMSLGELAQSKTLATEAAASFDALRKLAGKARPYDSLLYAAALNQVGVAERESGKPDEARKKHSQAAKILEGIKTKPPANVVVQDIDHMLARCRFDQAKTFAKYPELRGSADTNLSATAVVWADLSKRFPKVPLYQASQANAFLARGQLRLEDKRQDEAKKDFEAVVALLKPMVEKYPEIPGYGAELGRAYLGLGRHARQEGNKAEADRWYDVAAKALAKATEQSPRNVQIEQSLKEARREQKN